jgi:hypothetical protein
MTPDFSILRDFSRQRLARPLACCFAGLAALAVAFAVDPLIGGIVLVSLAAAVVVWRPAFGVYGAIAVAPLHLYRHAVGPANFSLFRVLILMLAVALGAHFVLGTRQLAGRALPASVYIVAILIVAYVAEAAVQSGRSLTGLGETIFGQRAFFLASAFVLALGILWLGLNRRTVLQMVIFSAIPPFLLAFHQLLVGDPSASLPLQTFIKIPGGVDAVRSGGFAERGLRPAATFADPNFLAIFAALTFIIADSQRGAELAWLRVTNALMRLTSVIVIVVAGSRTGVVIVAVYLLATRAARWSAPLWAKAIIAGALLSAIVFIVFVGGPIDVLGRGNPSQSTHQHVETRAAAVGIGMAHPVFGVGIGNLGPLLGEPPDRSSAHALPFTVFAEEGALGLLLTMLAIAFPFLLMLRSGTGGGLGLALGVFVALWLYDFMFILDVAAIWWAIALSNAGSLEAQAPQRLNKLWQARRHVADSATASPTYTAEAAKPRTNTLTRSGSAPPVSRAIKKTTASAEGTTAARKMRRPIVRQVRPKITMSSSPAVPVIATVCASATL